MYKFNYILFVKACKYEVKSIFYEIIIFKILFDVFIKLVDVGDIFFFIVSEVVCGGDLKFFIRIKNFYILVYLLERKKIFFFNWWKKEFEVLL